MSCSNVGDGGTQGAYYHRYSTIRIDWQERIKKALPLVKRGCGEKPLYDKDALKALGIAGIPICKNKADASGLYAACLVAARAGLSEKDLIARFGASGQLPDQLFRNGLLKHLNKGGMKLRQILCDREALGKAIEFLSTPRDNLKFDSSYKSKITLPWQRPFGAASFSLQNCIQEDDAKGTLHYLDLLDELHVIAGKRGISARDLLKSMKKQE